MCDDSINVIALLEYTESVEEEQPDKAQRTHTQKLVSLLLCVMAVFKPCNCGQWDLQ